MAEGIIKNAFISEEVLKEKDFLINLRRRFHEYPELGYMEFNTQKIISDYLNKFGLKVTQHIAKTGVVGLLAGNNVGKTILLRADMDALPLNEKNTFSFKSKTENVMHACGHDAHMAMLLTAAKILSNQKNKFAGNIKFIFQPNEESSAKDDITGAKKMIEEGVLKNPKVDFAFACHVSNDFPVGKIAMASGVVYANCTDFYIKIIGKGGHAGYPHLSIDPINIAAHLILAINSLKQKMINAFNPVNISIGKISSGTATNVIPEELELAGTIRTHDKKVTQKIINWLSNLVNKIPNGFGAKGSLAIKYGTPELINNPKIFPEIYDVAKSIVGEKNIVTKQQKLGGEDMAYFFQNVPGFYFVVGTSNKKKKIDKPLHSPEFNIDEDAMLIGVEMFNGISKKFLNY